MKIQPTKECRVCGQVFPKPSNISLVMWAKRYTCSKSCGGMRKNYNGTYEHLSKVCKFAGCRQLFNKSHGDTHKHFAKQEYCSISCSKMGRYNGKASASWKGEWASYGAVHQWIGRKYGKPLFCEQCKRSDPRMYHWANVSGKHKRDRSDWLRLCVPCHKTYDLNKVININSLTSKN